MWYPPCICRVENKDLEIATFAPHNVCQIRAIVNATRLFTSVPQIHLDPVTPSFWDGRLVSPVGVLTGVSDKLASRRMWMPTGMLRFDVAAYGISIYAHRWQGGGFNRWEITIEAVSWKAGISSAALTSTSSFHLVLLLLSHPASR